MKCVCMHSFRAVNNGSSKWIMIKVHKWSVMLTPVELVISYCWVLIFHLTESRVGMQNCMHALYMRFGMWDLKQMPMWQSCSETLRLLWKQARTSWLGELKGCITAINKQSSLFDCERFITFSFFFLLLKAWSSYKCGMEPCCVLLTLALVSRLMLFFFFFFYQWTRSVHPWLCQ